MNDSVDKSVDLATEMNRMREKLLDLSLRNPLLSYRKSKRRTVQIVDELPNDIYDRLVTRGRALSFGFVDSPSGGSSRRAASRFTDEAASQSSTIDSSGLAPQPVEPEAGDEWQDLDPNAAELPFDGGIGAHRGRHASADKLQTNLTESKLNSLLQYVHREAKTAVQETGINYLHIALGFLSWRESEFSERDRLSPLILIPVQIERSANGRGEKANYVISWTEDDITENLCLQKKMERDFGIQLPEFDPDSDPESYFIKTLDRTRSYPEWEVKREALIGFFSFHKLSMYADIDPSLWPLDSKGGSSSLAERVICGAASPPVEASLYATDYDIDSHDTADDIMLTMDADSSQHSALCDIRAGRNLVIEGPPGTGKSQTIANAIADALASGKTILFVAEKLTALQVVHDRLEKLGLSDFCLELHSDASSPRHVYESLRDRLATSYESPTSLQYSRQTLSDLREKLNSYVAEMAKKVGPRSEPLYDVMWQAVELRNQGAIALRLRKGILDLERARFQSASRLLSTFGDRLAENLDPVNSPWWGYFPDTVSLRRISEIETALKQLHQTATELADALQELEARTNLPTENCLKAAKSLPTQRIRELAASVPTLDEKDLLSLTDAKAREAAGRLISVIRERDALRQRIENEFGRPWAELERKREALAACLEPLTPCDSSIEDLRRSLSTIEQLHDVVGRIQHVSEALQEDGFGIFDTFGDFDQAVRFLELLRDAPTSSIETLTEAMFDGFARRSLTAARRKADDIRRDDEKHSTIIAQITERFDVDWNRFAECADNIERCLQCVSKCNSASTPISRLRGRLHWVQNMEKELNAILQARDAIQIPGVGRIVSFNDYSAAVKLLQLLNHSIVAEPDDLTTAYFSIEGRQAYERAKKTFDLLEQRALELEELFHLPAVPCETELAELTRTLRRFRRSWFPWRSGRYRKAREKLDEFVQVEASRSLPKWISALEMLQTLANEEQRFQEEDDLKRLLGASFRGVHTDWNKVKTLFDWAHTAKRMGLDYSRAAELLAKRDQLVLESPISDLTATTRGFSRLLESDRGPDEIITSEFSRMDLQQLSAEMAEQRIATTQLEEQTLIIKASPDMRLADLAVACDDAQELAKLLEARDINAIKDGFATNADLKKNLGEGFCGLDTNWDHLAMQLEWADSLRSCGFAFEVVQKVLTCNKHRKYEPLLSEMKELGRKFRELSSSHLTPIPSAIQNLVQGLQRIDISTSALNGIITAIQDLGKVADAIEMQNASTAKFASLHDSLVQNCDLSSLVRDRDKWGRLVQVELHEPVCESPAGVDEACKWIESVIDSCHPVELISSEEYFGRSAAGSLSSLATMADRVTCVRSQLDRQLEHLESFASCDDAWICTDDSSICNGLLKSRLDSMLANMAELPKWAEFGQALIDCRRGDLDDFCNAAMSGDIARDAIAQSFELTVLENHVEAAFRSSNSLQRSRGVTLDAIRVEFQEYDRNLRQLNQREVAYRASQREAPAGNSRGRVGDLTELALIRHETQKQTRHCRIRELVRRAGEAAQALKPCFMMSPLSVSRFIPQNTVEFDIVIMDEASQIKPEDALGTILRAKQLVVVGDPKQLPPTSFFDRIGDEVDEEESTQMDNTESILEASMKVFQPFRRLRWHYRSQHEGLIRFSNNRFYDDDLVVFPSCSDDAGRLGVRHVFVEDATCSSGVNIREAESVVDAIVEHAITRPEDSLGVGAFNKKQAELIDELLQQRCDQDAVVRIAVGQLREHEEELFVKNLENVQGDERDVIFVCYTYGKDPASGKPFQRFGPINSEKGWRRLNVLITRSKKQMVVFSSMRPGDIEGGPHKSRGVNAYKDFLTYAMTGDLIEQGAASGRGPESPFEQAVARCVTGMGLEAVPQVGVAGFFIDLGVRRREGDRSFVLGIECDGATYHSARSARDRDRLREEVIRSRGWEIHRIWSTDWFLNQAHEEEKLAAAISNAMKMS